MFKWRHGLMAAGLLAGLAPSAFACTVPTEFPYDPTKYPSDVVIEGVATSTEQSDRALYADIKISNAYIGAHPADTYRLKWWVYDGSGMCEPPGPAVKVGQRVRVYLYRSDGQFKAQGWVLTDEYPKSKDEIQRDQAIARERAARQEKYFQVRGALSYNDPKDWLTIEDIPELRHSRFPVYLSFTVGPNGAIEECESGHVEPHQALDLKACKIIVTRAKLVPPKFPEERNGSFDMDPPDIGNPSGTEPEQASPESGRKFLMAAILLPIVLIVGGLSVWALKRARSQP